MPLSCLLAIDPGRAKCGVAVVAQDHTVLYRDILTPDALRTHLPELLARFSPERVLVGDGTGGKSLDNLFASLVTTCPLTRIDERHTSEEARKRYLQAHPARGWRRLLPAGLRVPETPYDDFVAILLAERWWNAHSPEGE